MQADIQNDKVVVTMTPNEFFKTYFYDANANQFKKSTCTSSLPTSGNIDADITTEITNILSSVGIPRSIKGFSFLREAIVLSVNNEDYIKKITKKLYPEIAKKFNETPHRVERAIRWAIETAFSRIDFSVSNTLNKLFPASGEKFKVTNSEFIATIADDIRLRRRRESV